MNLKKLGGIEGGYTLCVDREGYEHVLVVAKATFDIRADGECVLAEDQQSVAFVDEHYGDPATSSIRYECDFSLHKPLADVVVNGTAYAPGGRPTTDMLAGVSLATIRKLIRVVGDRTWGRSLVGTYIPSAPDSFTTMPLIYERAFGGADTSSADPQKHVCEERNLVGIGCCGPERIEVSGAPLPNLEHPDHPIQTCTGHPPPVGVGFVSRNWMPRRSHAGTYDAHWQDNQFPFLPEDFDDRYFQGAPEDQQCAYLQGGERAVLINMTPEGRLEFEIPHVALSMQLVFRSGHQSLEPKLDTVIVEPDERRCILSWRGSTKLTRKLTDIYEVWVGTPSKAQLIAMHKEKRFVNWAKETT